MSVRMTAIKDRLNEIREKLSEINKKENKASSLLLRLGKVINILVENEQKIWLRTKVGDPILKDLQESVEASGTFLELENYCLNRFEASFQDVEFRAAKIDEESRRRSMVVT
jgi:hypothetical protein